MTLYSHSKLSTFEQCKLKYRFKYIDKIKPDFEKTIEAHLGTSVHNALEWLYKNVINEKIPTMDQLILKYIQEWKKDFKNEIKIIKQEFKSEDYFNKGIKFLIDYYAENQPFQDGTIELEKEIKFQLHPEMPYKLRGFIDRLAYNLEKKRYEIHDYKTANSLPTQDKMDNDRQLAIYGIAIKELFGQDKEVILIWHYLDHNKKIISKRTNEQYENLRKEILELIKEVEKTKEFLPTTSALCPWCEYKSSCPSWK